MVWMICDLAPLSSDTVDWNAYCFVLWKFCSAVMLLGWPMRMLRRSTFTYDTKARLEIISVRWMKADSLFEARLLHPIFKVLVTVMIT
jgi:hypothetical protein